MKIRRLQITIEPWLPAHAGFQHKLFTVEVRTDCGTFTTTNVVDDNHFQDVFGFLMKDAERRIRQLVKEKTAPADIKI